MTTATAPSASQSSPDGSTYSIKFIRYREQSWWKPKFNTSWRWAGRAAITFSNGQVEILGKREGVFGLGRKQEARVALSDILNAFHEGCVVHCEARFPGQRNRPLNFTTATEDDAREIVKRFPTEQSVGFARERADQVSFKAALDAAGSRAVVTPTLVGLNVLAYIVMVAGGVNALSPDGYSLIHWGSNFGPQTLNGEWWRLFTSMFLHFGLVHLLLNMWTLWSIGTLTERLFGSTPFALLYVTAGLAGSMISLLWNPDVNSAGASGAIFGVIGGLLAFVLNPKTRLPPSIVSAQRNSLVVFIAYNLLNGVTHPGIDNACHLGGLVSGLLMGWALARPLSAEARMDTAPAFGSWLGLALAVLGCLWWPLAHPSTEQIANRRFQTDIRWFAEQEKTSAITLRSLAQQAQQHQITQRERARRVQSEVIPLWQGMADRLQDSQFLPGSKFQPLRVALIRYVDSRKLALKLADEAALEGNTDKQALAMDAIKHSEADAEEVRTLVKELL